MKNKLKNLLKLGILILFIGCNKDSEPILEQEQQIENLTNTFFTKRVKIDDIPEISSYLGTNSKKSLLSKNSSNKVIFNFEDILEVVDTLGQTTYSINFSMANTPKTVMYNLVIGKDSLGQKTDPIILKYSSKQETYNEWANNDFRFGFFSGNLELFSYSDFFENNTFSKTAKNNDCGIQFDANGDPIPCFRNEITRGAPTNSNSGGGIPNNNNNPSGSGIHSPNPPSRGSGCRISTYWRKCGGSNQYTAHSAASCGGDGGGAGLVLRINCGSGGGGTNYSPPVFSKSSAKGNDDCDRCKAGISGGVGVNTSTVVAEKLNALLSVDPFKLLEIDCDQIKNWQSLAQHTPPQSIKDKIQDLKNNHEALLGDWDIQYLNDAGGTIVNMDYFGVNITALPNNPSTGQQFTPQQFLDYFRRNINNFVDGTTFEPYCEISAICTQETNLWNSSNPMGAIVKLDIPINDGVVVCAEYTSDYWRFMTMEAPFDNSHPVSGTRQFGIEQNSNGSYNIYVRGVDRFSSNLQENVSYAISLGNPFFGADNLWESFQKKTMEFVNQNSGVSSIVTPVHNRPDWNKIKDVLEGKRPISDLGCN